MGHASITTTYDLYGHLFDRHDDDLLAGLDAAHAQAIDNVVPLPSAYLAAALLVGLVGNALVGAWWLDPIVGFLIADVAVKEGAEAWRGDGCCVASPLPRFADDCCDDDCSAGSRR